MRIRLFTGLGLAAALFALAACRSAPDVAAYVGDRAITEQQITDLVDGYNAGAPDDRKVTRGEVVQYAVHDELCETLRRETGLTFSAEAVPNNSPELAYVAARVHSCLEALPVTGGASEAELRDLFAKAKAAGRYSPEAGFEDVRQDMQQSEDVQRALARQRALTQAAQTTDLTLNPRYRELQNLALNPLFADRLQATGRDAVVDRPAPAQ